MATTNGVGGHLRTKKSFSRFSFIPSYPSNSLDFLHPVQASKDIRVTQSRLNLNIIIVGAGLGGLATACALARRGHHVTVFEQANQLGEVGAGIQMPPNSARLLIEWGIDEFLEQKVVEPTSIKFRRWKTGDEIGCTRLVPEHRNLFDAPYYVVHRAHFHDALYKLALKLGAKVRIASKVEGYNPRTPSIILSDGQVYTADLVVAADGIKSMARKIVLNGQDVLPRKTGFAAYRATVDVAEMKKDPDIAWIVEQPNINLWVGDSRHVMTYPIASGKSFNMVLSHPQDNFDNEATKTVPETLREMREHFDGWDPQLTKVISLIHTTLKWPLYSLPRISRYVHPSSKLVVLGDGAHAMLPYMSQGAAMAVEDGAALAEALHLATTNAEVSSMLELWNDVRVERGSQMQEASSINGKLWHFQDGLDQEARDAAMAWEVMESRTLTADPKSWHRRRKSPNQWSDWRTSMWCFGYEAEREIQRHHQMRTAAGWR